MKKILFLTPNLSSGGGGAERQIINVARLLKEVGHNVEVLYYSEGLFYYNLLEEKNISIFKCKSNNYFLRLIKIRSFIRKGKYDVVISFLSTPNFLNNFSAIGGKDWKIITGERNSKINTFTSRRGKLFAWFQRYSDVIVCNSYNAKNMWIKYYPQYTDKLTTIYNNVQLPETTSENNLKRNGVIHIVIAASYQYTKNPIGVVNALLLLDDKSRERIKIDWYGKKNISQYGTKAYDEAKSLILNNKLNECLELHDVSNDIANKMVEADFVGLFSSVEGLPNAICEGMMLGKPIIMSRVSDYSVLVDETNGFLCDWDDAESIKDVLISAMNLSKEQLLEMGESSKSKANKLFSKNVITNNWLSIIKAE